MKKFVPYLLLIILVVIDQLTKFLFFGKDFSVGFFRISFVKNTGMSFGLFQGSNLFLIFVSIIALVALVYFAFFSKELKSSFWFLLVIISGTLGNLVDRVFRGFVVDFINFGWWPVFNVADSLIFIGVFGLLINELFFIKTNAKTHIKKK